MGRAKEKEGDRKEIRREGGRRGETEVKEGGGRGRRRRGMLDGRRTS